MNKQNAVIYTRVSTNKQSTQSQTQDLKQSHYHIIKEFTEQISGRVKNRPVLMECIRYAKENNINTILVWELSRLGRSTVDVLNTIELIKEANINLHIKQFNINTITEGKSDPMSNLFLSMLAAVSELEITQTRQRLERGYIDFVANGGKVGRKGGKKETTKQFLSKHTDVIKYLKYGMSIREVAKITHKSTKTVHRVKLAMGKTH